MTEEGYAKYGDKEYRITPLRVIYDNGSTHMLTVTDMQGAFISPERRYRQERILYVGTEAECRAELAAVQPQVCTANTALSGPEAAAGSGYARKAGSEDSR